MPRALFSWIGFADLRAVAAGEGTPPGPIAQALDQPQFDEAILLSDHEPAPTNSYLGWLRSRIRIPIRVEYAALSSPTNYGEIYEHATRVVTQFVGQRGGRSILVFHLSPGTPAMAAIWILLAKTKFKASLIESSPQHGVQSVELPFDISAEYIPGLYKKPDAELIHLAQGLPPDAPEFTDIVHRCDSMKKVVLRARKVSIRNIPVLLLGESGTGKELVARAIHRSSPRREGPFVAVNCGAIPHELAESELFGHVKGAFTGASSEAKGCIEAASGGTLFLDEVGELSPDVQVKLLRVLQDSGVRPVGSLHSHPVDFRLISATNRNIKKDVGAGSFREDFFHRIAVAIITIPPLRDRHGDLGVLVDTLLGKINRGAAGQPGYEEKTLSPGARSRLLHHSWPGNVRELHNTLQRAAIWSSGPLIKEHDIEDALIPIESEKNSAILDRPLGDGFSLSGVIQEVATHYIRRSIEEGEGSKTRAAKLLGLSNYQTLSNWIERYGIKAFPKSPM